MSHRPGPLYCVVCLSEGLSESLAVIGEGEEVFADEDGQPVCSMHGFEHNVAAMDR